LNRGSGLARRYRAGDRLLGVVSTKPGVVGNSAMGRRRSVLVALVGQVPLQRSQVRIDGDAVETLDGVRVGLLLQSGDVFLSRGDGDEVAALKRKVARLENLLTTYVCARGADDAICEDRVP
jgi:hypothetical protein